MTVKYKNLTAVVTNKIFHCSVFIYQDSKLINHQYWNIRPDYEKVVNYLKEYYEFLKEEEHDTIRNCEPTNECRK